MASLVKYGTGTFREKCTGAAEFPKLIEPHLHMSGSRCGFTAYLATPSSLRLAVCLI